MSATSAAEDASAAEKGVWAAGRETGWMVVSGVAWVVVAGVAWVVSGAA